MNLGGGLGGKKEFLSLCARNNIKICAAKGQKHNNAKKKKRMKNKKYFVGTDNYGFKQFQSTGTDFSRIKPLIYKSQIWCQNLISK